jgi:hypothetical protein
MYYAYFLEKESEFQIDFINKPSMSENFDFVGLFRGRICLPY